MAKRKRRITSLLAVMLLAVSLPAVAEIYTVTLTSGYTIQTRYRPVQASWDESRIVLMTDVGNWISLKAGQIAGVTSETERRGWGRVIDNNTIALGWAPNDAAVDDPDAPVDSAAQLLEYLQDRPQRDYSLDQFVEPEDAGGIPIPWLGAGNSTPPMGGPGRNR